MLVLKYLFFLLNVLIWSIFIPGIKIRPVLKLKLNGLHEKVQSLTLGDLEAEKLQKPRWPKYCESPCSCLQKYLFYTTDM